MKVDVKLSVLINLHQDFKKVILSIDRATIDV